MIRRIAGLACLAVATGLCVAGASAPPAQAQSIVIGPDGVRVVQPDRDRDRHHDRDRDFRRHHHDFDRDERWHSVRDRMRVYRDDCRHGDRDACVKMGIIIGQNQERRKQWRREHPDYFWWDRR